MIPTLANALGYQAVWFAAVLGAARGVAWPGVVAAAVFVAMQPAGPRGRRADAVLMLAALAVGVIVDGALAASGRVDYAAHAGGWPAPSWILAVWVAFAATLERSLRVLRSHLVAALALGALGGPLAWLAAAKLGAIAFAAPALPALVALGAAWAVVLPALLALTGHRVAAVAPLSGSPR